MKKTLIIPAVIGLLAVPSFALAHVGNGATAKTNSGTNTSLTTKGHSDADADDTATIPAVPATPATPATQSTPAVRAIPATPAVPAVDNDSDDVAGQVETENENNNTVPDDSGHHANVSASTEHGHDTVSVGAKIDN